MVDVPVQVRERKMWGGEMDLFDRVRERAYELFCERGGEAGHEHEDWLRAEEEVMCGADAAVVETGRGVRLRCRLPGFPASGIRVRAGDGEIVVEAERQGDGAGLEIRNVYRRMSTGAALDADGVTAVWDGSVLEVRVGMAREPAVAGEFAGARGLAGG